MSKKILYVTTIGETMSFFGRLVTDLVNKGIVVDIACNDDADDVPQLFKDLGCNIYHIDCSRSPLKKGNMTAIKQLRKLVSENKYDIVHCHTPIAAACTRLACKKLRKSGVKVFYTAHGFHFYKGAPVINWLLFYPIEKICAKHTDVLITINRQDYERATMKMKAARIEYVPGVGLDVAAFNRENVVVDCKTKRTELSIPEDAYLILSVGELNDNKNHETVIRALADKSNKAMGELVHNKNIHYAIAGVGDGKEHLEDVISDCDMTERVHLLGFRKDIPQLFKISDLFVHPSYREGLPVAVMEAMASGITVCGSDIRGCQDLIDKDYLFNPKDMSQVQEALVNIIDKDNSKAASENVNKIWNFDINVVNAKMLELYGV